MTTKSRSKEKAVSAAPRIADPILRETVFNRRKHAMFRRAQEMSDMCDCDIAVIVINKDGDLSQYSSTTMEDMLRRYTNTCIAAHETQTKETMTKRALEVKEKEKARKRQKPEDDKNKKGADSSKRETLPPLPFQAPVEDDIDETFQRLIAERAKRAQQAGTTGNEAEATNAASRAGQVSAIDSLYAVLAGVNTEPAAAPATEAAEGVKEEEKEGEGNPAAAAEVVDTPEVEVLGPPVASADEPPMLAEGGGK